MAAAFWLAFVALPGTRWMPLAVAVGFVLVVLPGVFMPPLGGVLADRMKPRTLLLVTDAVQGVLMATVILAMALPGVPVMAQLVWVGVVLLLSNAASFVHKMAQTVAVSRVVAAEDRPRASAAVATVEFGFIAASPMIAAAMIPTIGLLGAASFNVATFVVSFAVTWWLKIPAARGSTDPATGTDGRGGLWQSLRSGVQVVRRSPQLVALVWVHVFLAVGLATFNALLTPYAESVGFSEHQTGWLLTGVGVAGILAAAVLPRVFRRWAAGTAVAICAVFSGVLWALLGVSDALAFTMTIAAVAMFLQAGATVHAPAVLMGCAPDDAVGRVAGLVQPAATLSTVGVALAAGGAAVVAPYAVIFAISGVLVSVGGVIAWWRLRGHPTTTRA